MAGVASADMVSVTVHGPFGALDLAVPAGAAAADVVREYAAQTGQAGALHLLTARGEALPASASLAASGVRSGSLLVASETLAPPPSRATEDLDQTPPPSARAQIVVAALSAVVALAAAYLVAGESSSEQSATVAVLALVALVGVLPMGAHQAVRAAAAPVFAAAASFAVLHEPGAAHLPVTVGVSALVAAVAAATARALGTGRREIADVTMAGGVFCFALSAVTTLTGAAPQVHWALLLLAGLLAARFVPMLAIDVPDQLLVDLERLAITAWSARDRRSGKRRRTVIAPRMVDDLLATGAVVVNAAGVVIAAVVVLSAGALLSTADTGVDRYGAVAQLFFVGGGLLLVARSLRHAVARIALRGAGVFCWALLGAAWGQHASGTALIWTSVVATLFAVGLVAAAIATGRGWRSVRWARRAEIAEVLCGAFAIAAVVVASGLFRVLWESQT